MLFPHLRKFSDFYEKYGYGAVKNIWLLTCLIPIARTVKLMFAIVATVYVLAIRVGLNLFGGSDFVKKNFPARTISLSIVPN
jgi:hypothetical protein